MSKLIKKFQQPAGPIEFYSGMLPEVEVAAPIKHINDKTTGVYQVDSDLKRRNGRGRVYRGHRDGRDIYYLTSKNSDKIIGYTYDLPDENGKWSWNGYQDYLDNWAKSESSKPEEGKYDRTHTERRKEIKRSNSRNPMYRGLTLNGNTDLSYAGTQKNNENQEALGQDLQAALNAAAAAMFMGGPAAADTMFDLTDGFTNAATGNWGMAGLSFGSALLPGISYGAYRMNNALDNALQGISPQNIAEATVHGMTPRIQPVEFDWDAYINAGTQRGTDVTQPVPSAVDVLDLNIPTSPSALTRENVLSMPLQRNAQYRIGEWLRPEYANHNVRNFTTHIPSAEVAETLRYFGLTPTGNYMDDLNALDDYLIRARALTQQPTTPSTRSVRILGNDYQVTDLPENIETQLTQLGSGDDYGLMRYIESIDDADLPNVLSYFGLPYIHNADPRRMLRAYLNPTSHMYEVYNALNSGIPELSNAFQRLGPQYRPLNPELVNAFRSWRWNPSNNALLEEAIRSNAMLPAYEPIVDHFRRNMQYNMPTHQLHYDENVIFDGTFPIEAYQGLRAATPELAKQHKLRAPDGVRGLFTEEDILGMSPQRIHALSDIASDEPNFTLPGVSAIEIPTDITSDDIVQYLTETKNGVRTITHPRTGNDVTTTALADEYVRNNMTSGHVITPHSLSVDSYPLKMQKIAEAVRRGDVVKYPSNGYQRVNGYGMRNRLNTSKELLSNADKLKAAQKAGVLSVEETTNELGNRVLTYGNTQTGESFGSVEILSNQQTVDRINDYVNYFFRNYPENMRPEPAMLDGYGYIKIPKTYYVVKKQGGKLIPKQTRFNI